MRCTLCNQQVCQIGVDKSISIVTFNKKEKWTSHIMGRSILGNLCYYHEKVRKGLIRPNYVSERNYYAALV